MTNFYIAKDGVAIIKITKFEGRDRYLIEDLTDLNGRAEISGNTVLDMFVTVYLNKGYQVYEGEPPKNEIEP